MCDNEVNKVIRSILILEHKPIKFRPSIEYLGKKVARSELFDIPYPFRYNCNVLHLGKKIKLSFTMLDTCQRCKNEISIITTLTELDFVSGLLQHHTIQPGNYSMDADTKKMVIEAFIQQRNKDIRIRKLQDRVYSVFYQLAHFGKKTTEISR